MKPALRATEWIDFSITAVRGRANVLAHSPLLADLAARCGQRGAVDHLAFRFSDPYFGAKLPSLFLFYDPVGADSRVGLPVAAVLLHEYRLLALRTGVYIPADPAGDWAVLAPPGLRAKVAQHLAAHLLSEGAHLTLFSLSEPLAPTPDGRVTDRLLPVATAQQPLLRALHLCGTLDDTLSSMGAHTRRNLRLARRQAVTKLGARFEPAAELPEDEFLTLNHGGFYPVPDRVARWRYRSAHESTGGFLAGVRGSDGHWLALVGGRRYHAADGPCTAVDWQWNRTAYSRFSPGSLMRILLIEHELASGSTLLRFEGGTPHSMRSAFHREQVANVLYARACLTAGVLRRLGRWLPKGNLLGDLLASPHLVWH